MMTGEKKEITRLITVITSKIKFKKVVIYILTLTLIMGLLPGLSKFSMVTAQASSAPTGTFNIYNGTWSSGTAASHLCSWDGTVLTVYEGADIIVTTNGVMPGNSRAIVATGKVSITLNNAKFGNWGGAGIFLSQFAELTLTLTGDNIVGSVYSGSAGIQTNLSTKLTINGTGILDVSAVVGGGAGIGGGVGDTYGNEIIINSGYITAKSASVTTEYGGGAAIGGGRGGSGSNITINGGTITATSLAEYGGAGIGGGAGGGANNILITGGIIVASGSGGGAGIGGGSGIRNNGVGGDGSYITISGGKVTASGSRAVAGGAGGAGIGGGAGFQYGEGYYSGLGAEITISGGEVIAEGGFGAAGIGGGSYGLAQYIAISNGNVTATGGTCAAGIGGGMQGSGRYIDITGGTVIAKGDFFRAAGIGGGEGGDAIGIRLSGGTVIASGGYTGIGSGEGGTSGAITINGASITASTFYSYAPNSITAIGGIDGIVTVTGQYNYWTNTENIAPEGVHLFNIFSQDQNTFSPQHGFRYIRLELLPLSAPTIITNPIDQSVTEGQNATFTVSANGNPAPTYQWQVNTGSGWTTITGANDASYTVTNTTVSQSGSQYRAAVSNNQGSVNSTAALLTVNALATVPGAPQNLTATPGNGQVTLNWVAPDSNGGSAIIRYEVHNGSVWETAASPYTLSGLTNGTIYSFRVRAVNSVGAGAEASIQAIPVNPGTVRISNTAGRNGDIVTMPITLENNPGITAMMFDVNFDDTVLRIADTNANMRTALLNGWNAQTSAEGKSSPIRFSWRDGLADVNNDSDGVIVNLKFEILTDIPGVYPVTVTLSDDNITNANQPIPVRVPFVVSGGSIEVLDFSYGDVTGSGQVTFGDATLVERLTAGWSGLPAIDLRAADVNSDGLVNFTDATIIERHVAEWLGYETLPMPVQSAQAPFMMQMFAAGMATVDVADVSGSVGDIVEVSIRLENNPGITAMMFDVNFDDTVLRIADTNANMRTGMLNGWNAQTSAVGKSSPVRFSWRDGLADIDNDSDGVIVNLKFEILAEGVHPITVTLSESNITNANLSVVSFDVSSGSINATDSPTAESIVLTAPSGNPGDEVDVVVSYVNNPGIAGFILDFEYDTSILTPVSVTKNPVLDSTSFVENLSYDTNIIRVTWVNGSDVTTEQLFTICFKIEDNAADGETHITVAPVEIATASFDLISATMINGSVTVISANPGADITTVAAEGGKTAYSITVTAAAASPNPGTQSIEYAISTSGTTAPVSGWQSGLTFSGLSPGTTYYVWARTAAKPGYNAGVPRASLPIRTNDGTQTYPGAAITTVAAVASKTQNSITVNAALAMSNPGTQSIEYAISTSGTTAPVSGWQSGLIFTGLSPNTTYYVWARTAAKPYYDAGTARASLAITTDPPPVVYSDVNGDGVVDEFDLLLLLQYIVGLKGAGDIDLNAAKIYLNGSPVGLLDAILLARYLADPVNVTIPMTP